MARDPMVKRVRKRIPWKTVKKELEGWYDGMSGEFPLHSWVINNSEYIAPGLRLVGVELYIEGAGNADVIFADRGHHTLYVVEAKDGADNLVQAVEEAVGYAKAIEEHQRSRGIEPWTIVAVGITIDYGNLRDDQGRRLGGGVLYRKNQTHLISGKEEPTSRAPLTTGRARPRPDP